MTDVLKVDVWSDIACPWCYVGKRRFANGLQQYVQAGGSRTVEVEYHSFELAPDTPVDFEGTEVDFLVDFKRMPAERVRQMLGQMTDIAAGEGLAYDFGKLQHTKTLKAHELLHHAKLFGMQEAMKERLLRAYFVEGRHIGHIDDLADLAAEVGMHRDDAVAALTDGRHAAEVKADIERALAYGISGVPFYVIDGRFGVSGAQSPDVFAQALEKADE
jgi:predicted DsbA family dithiol-disulfide isomerase